MGRRARIGKIGKWTEAGACGQAAGESDWAAGACGQAAGVYGWLLPLRITACCRLVSGLKL